MDLKELLIQDYINAIPLLEKLRKDVNEVADGFVGCKDPNSKEATEYLKKFEVLYPKLRIMEYKPLFPWKPGPGYHEYSILDDTLVFRAYGLEHEITIKVEMPTKGLTHKKIQLIIGSYLYKRRLI